MAGDWRYAAALLLKVILRMLHLFTDMKEWNSIDVSKANRLPVP